MRYIAVLLFSSVVFAQSGGKPGLTDPIKDPQDIPGNPNPGVIPPRERQPVKPAGERNRKPDSKEKQSGKEKNKDKADKANPSKQ